MTAALLDVSAATVRFGGIHALTEADFAIAPGTVTSLIGPNGAGKTTLLNAITGMVPLTSGAVLLGGTDISGLPPHKRAEAGVVRTFQNLEVFTSMSVLENVMAGRHALTRYCVAASLLRTPGFRRAERECREAALDCLEFVGLPTSPTLRPGICPMASSGCWKWPGPWPPRQSFCSWTNRPLASLPRKPPNWATSSGPSATAGA